MRFLGSIPAFVAIFLSFQVQGASAGPLEDALKALQDAITSQQVARPYTQMGLKTVSYSSVIFNVCNRFTLTKNEENLFDYPSGAQGRTVITTTLNTSLRNVVKVSIPDENSVYLSSGDYGSGSVLGSSTITTQRFSTSGIPSSKEQLNSTERSRRIESYFVLPTASASEARSLASALNTVLEFCQASAEVKQ